MYRWAVFGERKRIIVLDDPHGGNIVIEVAAPTDGFADHTAALAPIIQSFVFAVGS